MKLPIILVVDSSEIEAYLKRIDGKLDSLLATEATHEREIMATLQDVVAEVTELKTVDESVKALLQSLADKVAELQPNQAAIDQLAADIRAEVDGLSAAVTANTPPSP